MDQPNSRLRRLAPTLGLVFLAPLVAEFLMGNLPITNVIAYLAMLPMYGCGALLVRELARRTGRGWPTMIGLALAYGMVEESFITQTLFNPEWAASVGVRVLDYGFLPALGIAPPWTLFMVGVHTVWSISVPIALVETLTPARRTTPWLGNLGLGITAGLYALMVVGGSIGQAVQSGFVAPIPRLAGAAVVIAAIVWISFRLGRRDAIRAGTEATGTGTAPPPWFVGAFAIVAGAMFVLLYAFDPTGLSPWFATGNPLPAWLSIVVYLALFAITIAVITGWSRQAGWSQAHRLALAGGALLTYAWHSFPWTSIEPVSLTVDLLSNAICTVIAIAVLVVAARRVSQPSSLTPTH